MSESIGRLIVRLADQEVERVALSTQPLTIGRNPDNSLPLSHNNISRYHAEVTLDPQGLLVTDLGSSNGTFVDGTKLLPHQPHLIRPGQSFQIGPYELFFELAISPAIGSDDGMEEPGASAPPGTNGQAAPEPPVAPDAEQAPVAPVAEPPVVAPVAEPPVVAPVAELPVVAPVAELPVVAAPTRAPLQRSWDLILSTRRQHPLETPGIEQASRYMANLPMIFHDSDFLRRYLLLFEAVWEPLEYRQDHIELYFDPRTCPESYISWLADWFGLTINQHWPEGRRRQVLGEIFELYRWRGTRHGLSRMIELCTSLAPIIDDGDTAFVFRIRLSPEPGQQLDRRFLEQLIQLHKPAHAGYILEISP